MDIATPEDPPQLDIAAVTQLEALPEVLPKMDIATAEDPPQNDIAAVSSLRQLPDTKKEEEIDNRPFKKAKCYESSVLDNSLLSPTISTSSTITEFSESVGSKSDNQIDIESSPTADVKEPDVSILVRDNIKYDYLPQDYTLTDQDGCSLCIILDSSEEDILVRIDDISVKQRYLSCLLDSDKWVEDEVISAYICCMKDQLHVQDHQNKVYFENPYVTSLLKRDGKIGIHGPTGMTKNVKNYLNYDMIHLPINIKDSHWYLACINAEKCEIQVLDSLCWEFNRADLNTTLQGLQYHLDILKCQGNLSNHKWKDLDITKWTIIEQLEEPIQKDSSSCGLFMLKFMEYWTGHTLSHLITQEIITSFRYKLGAMLISWKTNKMPLTTVFEENDDIEGDPSDLIMSDTPFDQNQSEDTNSLSTEIKYQSLMSVLCNLNTHELVSGLCGYIKSISSVETLEKVWVQSSKPYPISLTLKQLQGMLDDELSMDRDCFNLVVRNIMFGDIQMVKKKGGLISKHYLDMQFWTIADYGRHPNFQKKLDVEQLSYSVRSWPGIRYSVSSCRSIHIPIQNSGEFILFTLDKDTRTVYIFDPNTIHPIYEHNSQAKYVKQLLWIAEYLPKAMSKACPGSTWRENIVLWQQQIVHAFSGHRSELSGYLVALIMSAWKDGEVHLPFLKDGYELRKQILGQLLTFKDNECEYNMPSGVLDFIRCIRKIKDNMDVKT